jgi:hypothetical protein
MSPAAIGLDDLLFSTQPAASTASDRGAAI